MNQTTKWEKKVREIAQAPTAGDLFRLQEECIAMVKAPPEVGPMTDSEKTQIIVGIVSLSGFLPMSLLRPLIDWVIAQPSRARTF